MLTCKDFLSELNDYLDETVGPDMRAHLEAHARQCPDCFVVADTTKRTITVFKGAEARELPPDLQNRLMQALQNKMAGKVGKT